MPKRKGETEQQWMARVRAAREYINRANNDAGLEFLAFMSLFHPEYPQDQVNRMSREISAEYRAKGYRA